jgi:GH35 family endo-1,4-beta-xylanase
MISLVVKLLQWTARRGTMVIQFLSRVIAVFFFTGVLANVVNAAEIQVLQTDTVATVGGYNGAGDNVTPVSVTEATLPFRKALRVSRATVGENSYAAAMLWTSVTPIKKGDLLIATMYLRNVTPQQGTLNIDLTFQLKDDPYTPTLSSTTPVDTQTWRKYAIPFRAIQDYPAGKSTLQIRYSLAIQSFDVGGVAITNFGQVAQAIPTSISNRFAYYYPGRGDAKATWRTAALARIAAIRRGNMTVRVVDAGGRTIPNAAVSVQQTQSPFVWGTAASAISLVCKVDPADSNRPCPTLDQFDNKPVTPADYRKLRAELLKNFDAGSFYNDLKWTDWHNDQQIALDGIAWMKRNKLPLSRGHNLIWPSFEPDYLMPQDIINRATPAADVKRVIAEHFAQELGVLRGQIPEWDVVNEPFSNTDIQGRLASPNVTAIKGVLTPSAVATWFSDARRLDPKARLFLNEYGIFENYNPAKQGNTVALVKYIQKLGAPVDGIGFQGHFGASGPVFSDMQRVIDEFSPLVKTFSVTEFDFETLDPKLQGDLMEDFMTFIYGQPKFNQFQMWGFWDGDHWLGNAPLYKRDWTLKPSGAVWQRLARNTWRTRANGLTDSKGVYQLNAFYGTYKIAVTVNGKTCATNANFARSGELVAQASC